jgi:hypothetical protein
MVKIRDQSNCREARQVAASLKGKISPHWGILAQGFARETNYVPQDSINSYLPDPDSLFMPCLPSY